MSVYHCSLGNHPMNPNEPRYQRVEGWERPGRGTSGRSGSSLVLREAMPVFACSTCIARRQAGLNVDQLAL